jgi:hypothetical protein
MTTIVPLRRSVICSQCGELMIAPEQSYDFSEEGLVINLWSCFCGNRFETNDRAAHAAAHQKSKEELPAQRLVA